jgi:hypothetical protein
VTSLPTPFGHNEEGTNGSNGKKKEWMVHSEMAQEVTAWELSLIADGMNGEVYADYLASANPNKPKRTWGDITAAASTKE